MKNKILALVISTIVGSVLGYLFFDAAFNGWFNTSWIMVESPPAKVRKMVAVDSFTLWIESDTGLLYYNAGTIDCKSNCWHEASDVPKLSIVAQDESVVDTACLPAPPLIGVMSQIAQCRIEEKNWGLHRNFIYVLRNDGNIYLWYTDYYDGESLPPIFGYLMFSCLGGIVFFVPTLFLVLYLLLIDAVRKRAQKVQENLPQKSA